MPWSPYLYFQAVLLRIQLCRKVIKSEDSVSDNRFPGWDKWVTEGYPGSFGLGKLHAFVMNNFEGILPKINQNRNLNNVPTVMNYLDTEYELWILVLILLRPTV